MEGPESESEKTKEKLIENFEELNDKGGLPEDILSKCMGGNADFLQMKNLMKNPQCSIFWLINFYQEEEIFGSIN